MTPIRGYKLPAGNHGVQLRNGRLGLIRNIQVTVKPGRASHRKVVFHKGQVIIDVKPWAEVYLRGKKLGTTPMAPIPLYEGTYQFKLVNPKLRAEKVVRVHVKPRETTKVVERF